MSKESDDRAEENFCLQTADDLTRLTYERFRAEGVPGIGEVTDQLHRYKPKERARIAQWMQHDVSVINKSTDPFDTPQDPHLQLGFSKDRDLTSAQVEYLQKGKFEAAKDVKRSATFNPVTGEEVSQDAKTTYVGDSFTESDHDEFADGKLKLHREEYSSGTINNDVYYPDGRHVYDGIDDNGHRTHIEEQNGKPIPGKFWTIQLSTIESGLTD